MDVVVVGGGPAGLTAASSASQSGMDVLVLEKKTQIGWPIRTTGGSWIKELELFGITEDLYHTVRKCRFISPTKQIVFDYPKAGACLIDVKGVYQFLAKKAAEAGARISLNSRVVDVITDRDYVKGVIFRDSNGENMETTSKIVIDASGIGAVVASRLGLRSRVKRFGVGAEYELDAPNCDQDEIIVILGNQIARHGYGWIAPCGGNRVRVGIAVIYPHSRANPRHLLDELVEKNLRFRYLFRNATRREYHRGTIPIGNTEERYAYNGLMIVGDAVNQPSSLIGEGIRYALHAGKMTGEIAAESIRRGDYSEQFLGRYGRLWKKRYGKRLAIAAGMNARVVTASDDDWDRYVGSFFAQMSGRQLVRFLRCEFNVGWGIGVLLKNPKLTKSLLAKIRRRFTPEVQR